MKNDHILVVLFVIVILGFLFFVTVQYQKDENNIMNKAQITMSPQPKKIVKPAMEIDSTKSYQAAMKTSYGVITLEFDAEKAPQTVNNFIYLARKGFYDNTIFHRVIKGFMIQGGDPSGNGTGGPGYTIPAEIGLKHVRGSIAMARQSDQVNPKRDSSGSQFYIAHQDIPQLDGQYTVFGKVIKGMDVVDQIASAPVKANQMGEDSQPEVPVKILSVQVTEQ